MLRKRDLTTAELVRFDLEVRQRSLNRETLWALWVLMSYVGAHRFYLGDRVIATAMFLTSVVPVVGIVWEAVRIGQAVDADVGSRLVLYFFWIGFSVLWSWVDGLRINGRFEAVRREVESEVLREIERDR